MNATRRRLLGAMGALGWAGTMPVGAQAQGAAAWPERPVKLFVSSAAGSAPDIMARLIGEHLANAWGKAVVIDNRPGAGGNLGAQAAARAPADGHVLWFAHATPVVMSAALFKAPGFDAEKDFQPVVRVGLNPMMIAVNASVPARDLKELVALAKARPGKLSYTTSGTRNIPHLVGESLNQLTGAALVNVPYKGSQQAAQDTAGGQAEVYIDAVPPMAPWIGPAGQGGRLRPLAVTAATRLPGFEGVPTAREQGVDLVMQGWVSLMAPASLSREVVDKVNRDANAALARPEVVTRLRALGTYEPGGSVRDFDAFIREERRRWERVVQTAQLERE